mmetsp:Transcript_6393/g.14444  ORF Transcript_6393/g.14444 Transcript_6393/m.14444 type:complete len:99 (-) Transcript_6393:1024-1320(-)
MQLLIMMSHLVEHSTTGVYSFTCMSYGEDWEGGNGCLKKRKSHLIRCSIGKVKEMKAKVLSFSPPFPSLQCLIASNKFIQFIQHTSIQLRQCCIVPTI